jgi:hypothetical protein
MPAVSEGRIGDYIAVPIDRIDWWPVSDSEDLNRRNPASGWRVQSVGVLNDVIRRGINRFLVSLWQLKRVSSIIGQIATRS